MFYEVTKKDATLQAKKKKSFLLKIIAQKFAHIKKKSYLCAIEIKIITLNRAEQLVKHCKKVMIGKKSYTIATNRSKKTYTIRVYEGGKLIGKYRSYPQGGEFSEDWTESDIYNFLRSSDYYAVR